MAPNADPGPKRDHRAEWFASLRRVQAYVEEFGYPTQRAVAPDGSRPGKWLAKQKERWDTLSREQAWALAALPGFTLDAREAHFEQMVDAHKRAMAAGVTLNYWDHRRTFDGLPVEQWLHDLFRGRITVTAERLALLQEAGIVPRTGWSWPEEIPRPDPP